MDSKAFLKLTHTNYFHIVVNLIKEYTKSEIPLYMKHIYNVFFKGKLKIRETNCFTMSNILRKCMHPKFVSEGNR